jgi:hypothetical protein
MLTREGKPAQQEGKWAHVRVSMELYSQSLWLHLYESAESVIRYGVMYSDATSRTAASSGYHYKNVPRCYRSERLGAPHSPEDGPA